MVVDMGMWNLDYGGMWKLEGVWKFWTMVWIGSFSESSWNYSILFGNCKHKIKKYFLE